jgi:hypothetical protein
VAARYLDIEEDVASHQHRGNASLSTIKMAIKSSVARASGAVSDVE